MNDKYFIDKKEVTEDRYNKFHKFSDFLNFIEMSNLFDNPKPSHNDLINRYLNRQEIYENAYKEMADYDNECNRHNERLLRVIKKVKGRTFHKYLLQIIKESDCVNGKMQIVDEPCGEFQNEKYGRTINGIWVDQWSVGMDSDSFQGYVCVWLKDNKFLKFSYSM